MRSTRCLAFAAVVAATLTASSSAPARTLPVDSHAKRVAVDKRTQASLNKARDRIVAARQATWRCQDQLVALGVLDSRTRAAHGTWQLPTSVPYRHWVFRQWTHRAAVCQKNLSGRVLGATGDWLTAVRIVQRVYPGTGDWLRYISHREGGWGRFVMNTQGSGAGGWMQFMASTFYAYNDDAYADARRRGFILPPATNTWTHPLGQALTAAYMRYTHRDGCHWCL